MASITLAKFRLVSQLSTEMLSTESAIQALCSGTGVARRITGREFGHAIEFAEQITGTTDVKIQIYGHHLPSSGTVLVGGTGIAGLTGLLPYTVIDQNSIRIAGVTLATRVTVGIVCPKITAMARVTDQVAVLSPGPIARVSQLRIRIGNMLVAGGPFPDSTIAPTDSWYIDTSEPSWKGEVEIFTNTTLYKRVAGMINPVKQRSRREVQATFYSGCLLGIPEDLETAIATISAEIAKDPSGAFQSENYDYYSYQRMDPAMVAKLPTSAVATLFSYRSLAR